MGKQLAEYLERDYRENWDWLRWLAGHPRSLG
jgi:hypothetical protein